MALQLHPAATLVAQASARLIEEVANLQAGRPHQVPAVHRAFVEQREAVEGQLGEARQATLDARRVCTATVGALLAPAAPKAHALPLWWQWTRLVP